MVFLEGLQQLNTLMFFAVPALFVYAIWKEPSHAERTEFKQSAQPEMSYRSAFPQPRHYAVQPVYAEAPPSELPAPALPQQPVSNTHEEHKPTPEDAPSYLKEQNGPDTLYVGLSAVECQALAQK